MIQVGDRYSNDRETIVITEINVPTEHITNSTSVRFTFTNAKTSSEGKSTVSTYGKLFDYLTRNKFKKSVPQQIEEDFELDDFTEDVTTPVDLYLSKSSVLSWISEQEMLFYDFLDYFDIEYDDNDRYLDVPVELSTIIDWLCEHSTAFEDFCNYFDIDYDTFDQVRIIQDTDE